MGGMSAVPLERDSDVGRLAAEVERSHERVTLDSGRRARGRRDQRCRTRGARGHARDAAERRGEPLRSTRASPTPRPTAASTTRTTFSPISVVAVTTPERYRVRFASRARRDLDGLPLPVATAMIELLLGPVARNPLRLGGPLRGRWEGYLSARRGGHPGDLSRHPRRVTLATVWRSWRSVQARPQGLHEAIRCRCPAPACSACPGPSRRCGAGRGRRSARPRSGSAR